MPRPVALSTNEKLQVVLSVMAEEVTIATAARTANVSEQSVTQWHHQFIEAGRAGLAGEVEELRVRAGAGVILYDAEGRILLMRRSDDGSWGIPGGGVEPGESWADAALRECREETGWEAHIDSLLGVYSDPLSQIHRYPNGAYEHMLGVIFLATAIERVGTPDAETAELRWSHPDSLPSPIFSPDAPVLLDVLGERARRPIIG